MTNMCSTLLTTSQTSSTIIKSISENSSKASTKLTLRAKWRSSKLFQNTILDAKLSSKIDWFTRTMQTSDSRSARRFSIRMRSADSADRLLLASTACSSYRVQSIKSLTRTAESIRLDTSIKVRNSTNSMTSTTLCFEAESRQSS